MGKKEGIDAGGNRSSIVGYTMDLNRYWEGEGSDGVVINQKVYKTVQPSQGSPENNLQYQQNSIISSGEQ